MYWEYNLQYMPFFHYYEVQPGQVAMPGPFYSTMLGRGLFAILGLQLDSTLKLLTDQSSLLRLFQARMPDTQTCPESCH